MTDPYLPEELLDVTARSSAAGYVRVYDPGLCSDVVFEVFDDESQAEPKYARVSIKREVAEQFLTMVLARHSWMVIDDD